MKFPEVVLSFMPVDKHLRYGQKSKSTSAVPSHGVICFSTFYKNEIEMFFVKLELWLPLAVKWLKTPHDATC